MDSDVDLLVDLGPSVGYFDLMAIREHLEAVLGRRVDVVPRRAIKRQLRQQILDEAVAFNLWVFGEAASQLPDEVREAHPAPTYPPQQRLYFLPEPQGQGALRPTFGLGVGGVRRLRWPATWRIRLNRW